MKSAIRTVLISGASSGLGAELALAYGRQGCTVGLVARRADRLASIREQVEKLGGCALALSADVCDRDAMAAAVGDFAARAGSLDLVIANAGIGEGPGSERFSAASAERVIQVNVLGLTNTLLPAARLQVEARQGVLVGMASVAGYRAMPGSLSYSASKRFVMTFMEGLRMELRAFGVHAMAICPGFARTPLTDQNDFPMPFRIEAEDAAARMVAAIAHRKDTFTFPLPFRLVAPLLQVVPERLLERLSPKTPRPGERLPS